MATRVELTPDLDRKMADLAARAVDQLTGQVQDAARKLAPDGKIWVTAHDERVRISHARADGQLIPDNLRYRLPAVYYVRKGRGPDGKAANPGGGWKAIEGRFDLARRPRDEALPVHQSVNCRCASVAVAGAIARSIHRTPVALAATRASAEVYTRFPRAAESEFGTSGDVGAHFMAGALREVAARLR
jgi:hypothetical protein